MGEDVIHRHARRNTACMALQAQVAVPAGLEPATSAFEARHSIQLSYGTAGGGCRIGYTPPLAVIHRSATQSKNQASTDAT